MISLLDLLGLDNLTFSEFLWVSFGTLGQLVFFSRWIIQWLSSEKYKTSFIKGDIDGRINDKRFCKC